MYLYIYISVSLFIDITFIESAVIVRTAVIIGTGR